MRLRNSHSPQNNRQNAGWRGKSRPNRPRECGRPLKNFEGRGKISAPTRKYAGVRLAPTVPRIAGRRLAGGTFQPSPFPHLLPPPPAIGSPVRCRRFQPNLPAKSRHGARPPPSTIDTLHQPLPPTIVLFIKEPAEEVSSME